MKSRAREIVEKLDEMQEPMDAKYMAEAKKYCESEMGDMDMEDDDESMDKELEKLGNACMREMKAKGLKYKGKDEGKAVMEMIHAMAATKGMKKKKK